MRCLNRFYSMYPICHSIVLFFSDCRSLFLLSPVLYISLSFSIALHVTLLLFTSLSISLNISKEWITLGCHLALANNSFLWVKCFKLSSVTGTISYNNYIDGPWLGVLSFLSPTFHIHAKKKSPIVSTEKGKGWQDGWEGGKHSCEKSRNTCKVIWGISRAQVMKSCNKRIKKGTRQDKNTVACSYAKVFIVIH